MITPAIAASTPSNCSPPSIEMRVLLPGSPDAFGVMVTTEASTANVTLMPTPELTVVLDPVLEPPLGVGPQPPERRGGVSFEITG